MKTLSKILIFAAVIITSFTLSNATTVNAYDENTRINNEITALIVNGTLPTWHNQYLSNSNYQKVYLKFKDTSITYFANLSKESLYSIIKGYVSTNKDFVEIVNNLSVPVTDLAVNQTIGIFYTGTQMQMIWSSEYIPHEGLNLKSLTVNGITINQQLINKPTCEAIHEDGIFETTYSYGFPTYNKQINLTPIGGYAYCNNGTQTEIQKYGFDVEQKVWKIERWSAGMESVLHQDYPDPTNYYNFQSTTPVTFELASAPIIDSPSVAQLSSHKYIELTEVTVQSTFDLLWGGYKHFVYFNTDPIEMEKIYRVDCNYTLSSDNKDFWQIWLDGSAEYSVQKSLTMEKNQAGLFNWFSYQGLTIGKFASNEKEKTYFKYRLHLNHKEKNWDWLSNNDYPESDFKRIKAFNIFRMNFISHGEEFDVEVKMDTISGSTLSIFARDLIMSTSNPIYQAKEVGYDITDEIKDAGNKIDTFFDTIGTIGSVVITVAVIYLGYLVVKKIKKLL